MHDDDDDANIHYNLLGHYARINKTAVYLNIGTKSSKYGLNKLIKSLHVPHPSATAAEERGGFFHSTSTAQQTHSFYPEPNAEHQTAHASVRSAIRIDSSPSSSTLQDSCLVGNT